MPSFVSSRSRASLMKADTMNRRGFIGGLVSILALPFASRPLQATTKTFEVKEHWVQLGEKGKHFFSAYIPKGNLEDVAEFLQSFRPPYGFVRRRIDFIPMDDGIEFSIMSGRNRE